jgi:hypothetical protein
MARGRLISKSLGSSRKFHALLTAGGKLGEFCQVLFPLVVANTDDYGRLPGDAFTIKNLVLPSSQRSERDFETALEVIAAVGLVLRYVVDDTIYLQVNNFAEHQPGLKQSKVERYPPPSGKIPELRENSGTPEIPALREVKGREVKGREGKGTELRVGDDLFDTFWANYPKKKAKDDARKAWDKRRPDADLLAVMLRALERQQHSPDWQKESGRYIPYPATWLNQARWTDEVDADVGIQSETLRYNRAASDEAERLILEAEARRTGTHDGHPRQH